MSSQPDLFPLTFRPMTLADVARAHEIDVLSFSLSWSERSYRFEITENRNSINLVAEISGPADGASIIGMIVIWVILDEAHVATIAVHPDYRGHRIGQKLLANGLAAAYERGARLAYLEVRKGNITAKNLYEKFGFKVVGDRPRYYKDNNEDALLMTLENLQIEQMHIFTQ
jgi:[ribosomal protein S18]-alanine N-acetyltransferase